VRGYEWAYGEGAAAGLIPTNDATCLCVRNAARMRSLRSSGAEHAFATLLALAAPAFVDRVAEATHASGLRGWGGLPGYLRRSWGNGWALVGDAGYFKDPITTHGMTDALRDAELLANAIVALLSGCPEASALAAYEGTRDRLSRDMFDVTEAVAAYDWNLDELRHLLRGVSAAMADEVDHLQSMQRLC
jgi:2-polyprenyl-6-methoxyphenol hydroxylase-like FAD-dependent oxidoreductase